MWCLITWTTYGYWLPGDPCGFRTRKHKEHVPPPGRYAAGEDSYNPRDYKTMFESIKKRVPNAVELSPGDAGRVSDVLKRTIKPVIERPAIVSVGRYHVHILLEADSIDISWLCKLAKGRSTMALRRAGFAGMKWARGYHTRFIESDAEARVVWRYVSRHKTGASLVERIDPDQS